VIREGRAPEGSLNIACCGPQRVCSPSDMTGAEWAIVEPWSRPSTGGPQAHDWLPQQAHDSGSGGPSFWHVAAGLSVFGYIAMAKSPMKRRIDRSCEGAPRPYLRIPGSLRKPIASLNREPSPPCSIQVEFGQAADRKPPSLEGPAGDRDFECETQAHGVSTFFDKQLGVANANRGCSGYYCDFSSASWLSTRKMIVPTTWTTFNIQFATIVPESVSDLHNFPNLWKPVRGNENTVRGRNCSYSATPQHECAMAPDTLNVLGAAFDDAWQSIPSNLNEDHEGSGGNLASAILRRVQHGE